MIVTTSDLRDEWERCSSVFRMRFSDSFAAYQSWRAVGHPAPMLDEPSVANENELPPIVA